VAEALLISLGVSLSLTLVIELVYALVWGVRGRDIWLVVLMNIMTNPTVVTIHFLFPTFPILILEAAVVGAEGLCARGRIRQPWLYALLVNTLSFSVGLLLQAL
jgi:hypothetical protein